MTKRVLFIVCGLPRAGALANETLDMILVTAAFDLRPTVLFIGDGVFQLLAAEASAAQGMRDIARAYTALPTYDVDRIYVEADALLRHGLVPDDLTLKAEPIDQTAIRSLIAGHDIVFTA